MANKKEFHAVIDRLALQGWSFAFSGGGHIKAKSPRGGIVVMPSSASDYRSFRNSVALLRRNGANL